MSVAIMIIQFSIRCLDPWDEETPAFFITNIRELCSLYIIGLLPDTYNCG